MDRKQVIINILAAERAESEARRMNYARLGKGVKVENNDRVRISGPVRYGDTTVRVSSEAIVLSTTKRRILACIEEVDNDGNVVIWVSKKCVYAAA